MKTLYLCFALSALFISTKPIAQVKVGDNPNTISSASLMELESTNKGFVFPRVSLSSITSYAPLAMDILTGTVVYNTNAAFTGGMGLYIWSGSMWMAVTPTSLATTNAWKLTGNSGTNPAINFLGTTDNQPLLFKVNSQNSGIISPASTAFGYNTLNFNAGGFNSAFGTAALYNNTTGAGNTAFGNNALANNVTGNFNTASGSFALLSNTGSYNTATGYYTLNSNTSGNNNTATGFGALYYTTTGTGNVANGTNALNLNTTGSYNTAIGYIAGVASNNLTNATAIGYNAVVTISNALVLGDSVNNIKVGIGTGSPTANLHVKGNVRFANLTNGLLTADAAGNLSTVSAAAAANAWSLTGNSGTDSAVNFLGTTDVKPLIFKINNQRSGYISSLGTNTSFGYQGLSVNTTGIENTAIGYNALKSNATGKDNAANGIFSLYNNTTGYANVANGARALYANVSGYHNTATGDSALYNNTASNNTATGAFALYTNAAGISNTANGAFSLYSNTTGNQNVAIGHYALNKNTSAGNNMATGAYALYNTTTGSLNVATGAYSLFNNITGGNNMAAGDSALYTNTTGSNNTAVGKRADVTSGALTNATALGANAKVVISNALILGDSVNNVKVGIGTGSPTANLHVKGSVRFANLTNGLLTADAAGNLSTVSASAFTNTWSLTTGHF